MKLACENLYADLIRGDWFRSNDREHHTGAVYLNGHWLTEAAKLEEVIKPSGKNPLWFASVDEQNTTISAQFPGTDPNLEGIDHNLLLSAVSLQDMSQGGAYAHNLFAGNVIFRSELRRQTPWQEEHGTKIAGLANIKGGDNHFLNNVFAAPAGLDAYDESATAAWPF